MLEFEPAPTGNHGTTKREEKAAVKKALQHDFVLPMHDWPARVERGRVLARLREQVPGPETLVEHRTPAEGAMHLDHQPETVG